MATKHSHPELPNGWQFYRQAGRHFYTNAAGRPSRSYETVVIDDRGVCVAVRDKKADAIADALEVVKERAAQKAVEILAQNAADHLEWMLGEMIRIRRDDAAERGIELSDEEIAADVCRSLRTMIDKAEGNLR